MADWTAGYVSDIEYGGAFYAAQAPAMLSLACLIAGIEPVPLAPGLRYLELGCGQGYTTNLLAAANPGFEFVGVDFNPAHIARARALAAAAGLGNVRFVEAGFAELAEAPEALGRADMIALHGIYSWVSPENRRAIVRLCGRCLEPGGLVYVSYNVMPGWAPSLPVQRLMLDCARLFPERSDHRMAKALDLLAALHGAKAAHLGEQTMVGGVLKLRERHLNYLTHEYLNDDWQPLWHADVRSDMAAAKLEFAGSAALMEAYDSLNMTPAQREVVERVSSPVLRETMKDFCRPRILRKDVFVRGARRINDARRDMLLRRLRLVLVRPLSEVRYEVSVPIGEGKLAEASYRPIFEALAEGPRSIGDLVDLVAAQGSNLQVIELAGMLVGSGQASPAAADGSPAGPALAFNRLVAEGPVTDALEPREAFAAPAIGSGVRLGIADRLAYHAVRAGASEEPAAVLRAVKDILAGRGGVLLDAEGRALEDQETAMAELEKQVGEFVRLTLPLLRRLGAL